MDKEEIGLEVYDQPRTVRFSHEQLLYLQSINTLLPEAIRTVINDHRTHQFNHKRELRIKRVNSEIVVPFVLALILFIVSSNFGGYIGIGLNFIVIIVMLYGLWGLWKVIRP